MTIASHLKNLSKSHRKVVLLPKRSELLAEFFGIMMGDGGINNAWQANITLNAVADDEYAIYVVRVIEKLFGVVPAVRKRKTRDALVISLASITIVDFLVREGLCRGNKLKGGLAIPTWILRSRKYRIACVRGLMDTDGGLYIHRHKVGQYSYENIGLCFTSFSPFLLGQVAEIFIECGIVPHVSGQGRRLYLYSHAAVKRYLDKVGTSNTRLERVFSEWKKLEIRSSKNPV